MRPIANALLIAALTLVGCTATPQRAADAVREDRFDPKEYSGTGVEGGVPTSLAAPMAAHQRAATAVAFPRASIAASMVIRTGQATIEVDSLERAVAQVRLLATRGGGYVANTVMQTGRSDLRSASLEVKIPAARVATHRFAGERHRQAEGRPRGRAAAGPGARGDRAHRRATALPPRSRGAQHPHHLHPRTHPGRGARGIERHRRSIQASVAELRRPGGGLHPRARHRDPARRSRDGGVAWRETPFTTPLSIGRPLTPRACRTGRAPHRTDRP